MNKVARRIIWAVAASVLVLLTALAPLTWHVMLRKAVDGKGVITSFAILPFHEWGVGVHPLVCTGCMGGHSTSTVSGKIVKIGMFVVDVSK